MNGYVEAGYLAVALGLGGYAVWIAALTTRVRRRERELSVTRQRRG
ncbi:hypothetical protein Afer_0335 [Acidimicrobium ferrooxidans DSM 10331]|uniref:Heme exporter protein D n=1 Tax=Acidimicrobium ferrooxidans (strain DSM 10331 / JCM 15462 / NBRC 103882 / ICP) TaxID=525909 RepID=C7M2Q9_ACIFD|nr:hypothetical protein [Acidimicrobium ferrooxidans]ACU53303.1 hypothetical protein Afer_0335 [Acidimicrobium ferrooxidans DSM 10331]